MKKTTMEIDTATLVMMLKYIATLEGTLRHLGFNVPDTMRELESAFQKPTHLELVKDEN